MQRTSSFELLRIVCILFIVAGHMFMGHNWTDDTIDFTIKIGLRPVFMVAVNCFILISGWFGIRLNWSKLLRLNNMVTFWSITLGIFAVITGLHANELRSDFLMLFPILTKRYWFITIYFVLCILAPYINLFIEKLNVKLYKRLLLILFCLFGIIPTLGFCLNFPSITEDAGYGIVNFVFLYLLGRYLRLYYHSSINKWLDLLGYFIVTIGCGLIEILYSKILWFQFDAFGSYNTIFMIFGAVLLFMFFTKLNFSSRLINWLATFCLAIYVIHLHPWVFGWLYQEFLGGNTIHGYSYLIFILTMPLLTFAACIVLESARQIILRCISAPFKHFL